MGFVLSVLYFVTYYLTPTTVFGPLAEYRVELILAGLLFLVSIPALQSSFIGKTPQTVALLGLAFATIFSEIFGAGWAGGGLQAVLLFIPNAYAYSLVCLHCNTRKKLQILVLMLLFVCLFVIAQGTIELMRIAPVTTAAAAEEADRQTVYVIGQSNEKGEWFYRLRGLGEINDPNDFGQVIVCLTPLVFMFWKRKAMLRNSFFVLLPVGILLFGAFETHSRGSLLALLAMVVVAGRRRIGTVWSLVLAGALFVGATAMNVSGGRDISASAGQDRLDLWGAGLDLLKSHPLFGVGLNQMADYAGLTAHNSVVVCAAELGLVGLLFWALFLFPTIKDAIVVASPDRVGEAQPIVMEKVPFKPTLTKPDDFDKGEANRLGQLMVLSLTGFLVAGWFLSRAFVMTLFLLAGMAEVIYQMALNRGMTPPRWTLTRVLPYAGGLTIALVMLMYFMVRFGNLMR